MLGYSVPEATRPETLYVRAFTGCVGEGDGKCVFFVCAAAPENVIPESNSIKTAAI